MQLTTNKEDLIRAVQLTMRIVNTSATLESLQGILIEIKDGVTVIKSTNLEIGTDVTIPTMDTEDGIVLVNPKILLDAIKYSDSKKVTITTDGNSMVIQLDTGKTTIKTLSNLDFPNIQKEKTGEKTQLKIKNIINGVRSVIHSVSHSVIKPELSSVYIWKDGQQLVFVATDSFRLSEKRVNQSTQTVDDLSILIPHKNIQDLVGVLEQLDEEMLIDVYIDKDQFSLYTDNIYITLRTIDGAFPDYQKIIPTEPTTEVVVLKQDFSQVIKKAAAFSDKFNKVVISVDKEENKITISTKNGEFGETTDSIKGTLEGESITMSINHRYALDCLQSITSDSVILSFFGQNKPVIIRGVGDKSFTYLLMPMNN